MNKYCRICWNTSNWTKPTKEAAQLETGSYVSKNMFGHEEWLFDMAWPLSGFNGSSISYCYSFLQPINKYRRKYAGQTFDICLYTIDPDRVRLFVGVIREAYIPEDAELKWALAQFSRNGRLAKMNSDLRHIGVDSINIAALNSPGDVANVRFEFKNVEIFDRRPIVPTGHIAQTTPRYHPLNWEGNAPAIPQHVPALAPPDDAGIIDPKRNEALRIRAAISATQYSPEHVKLQNALYGTLIQKYGAKAVQYEKDFVDLTLTEENRITFFEIKTAPTAKGCIREAMGQLLEYSHYSDKKNASKLIVVGVPIPTAEDIAYIAHLRNLYEIPIWYSSWSWATGALGQNI